MVVVQHVPRKGGGSFGSNTSGVIVILVLLNLLFFQLGRNYGAQEAPLSLSATSSSLLSFGTSSTEQDPLRPQSGSAAPLPSLRALQANAVAQAKKNSIYGGHGDGQHLGGWTEIDINGLSPFLWRHMMTKFGIHSIIDVGCGRGISTTWFLMNGMDALCVEGSHDAYLNSVLPNKEQQMVEHDFSRGPYWPQKTYDAVWCVEFLEHVGRNFHKNYLPVFRKAAMLFVTHSTWGGWHHVEIHTDDWWIHKFELYGFKYMPELTIEVRETARQEAMQGPPAVNGAPPNPQNLYNMLVFFNPAVGALPQHAHLFAEPGCYKPPQKAPDGKLIRKNRDCGGPAIEGMSSGEETPLPPQFQPLPVLEANQRKWEEHIQKFIKTSAPVAAKNA
ncbi:expressed unknown protein [Seminavis robusta]|uniref:Methyltransferase type 11 domain-containing protein n=1 Tax=Seminavis robusta TaxID=568900 RepID=A0A9N8DQE3_9STRA|nr:expressed unknown protein [Seminavis robusta]|eukprot:Sro210_g087570.1 n/a (388) ;mRNA; r:23104-24444